MFDTDFSVQVFGKTAGDLLNEPVLSCGSIHKNPHGYDEE